MSYHYSLIQGPGSHSHLIEQFLTECCSTWDSYNYWPKFKLEGRRNDELYNVKNFSYDFLTTVLYGLNNKFNWLHHGQQLHKDVLFDYYDYLCSKYLNEPKQLIAWSQTSFKTIKKNRQLGGKNLLEHPMPHVNYWMEINNSFYQNKRFTSKPGFSRFSERMVKRMQDEYLISDHINVHSTFVRNTFIQNGVDPARILITPLGIRLDEFPFINEQNIRSGKFKILYIGRLELWKGVHLLIDVCDKMKSPNIELILAGRILPEIVPILKNAKSSIKTLGALGKKQLSKLIKESDVVVLPSLNDAFGMVILEAMAHAVPVIASTASAGPDIITEKENGMIVMAGSTESLEQAITWAFENRKKLDEIGNNARSTVHSRFLEANYFDRLKENLRSIDFM
jgi:glycosyltransferase involved in cell wall biosynthesis